VRGPSDGVFKVIAAGAALALVGFIVFVVVRGPSHSAPDTATLKVPPPTLLKVGRSAPLFSLPNLHGGSAVALTSFRGTPVILNFFASWCPNCRTELSAMAEVAVRNAGRVAVVGVDSNDSSTAAATQALASAHADFPVAVDAHARVATQYLLSALPVTYFLNAQGRIVGAALGAQTVTSLQRWVERLERGS